MPPKMTFVSDAQKENKKQNGPKLRDTGFL